MPQQLEGSQDEQHPGARIPGAAFAFAYDFEG